MKILNTQILILSLLWGSNAFCAADILFPIPENAVDKTDIFQLISANDLKSLNELLDHPGFNINVQNDNGETPLMAAIRNNNTKAAKLLLNKKADVNLVDSDGWSPLMAAIENLNEEIIKLLLCAGADLTIQTKRLRLTALQQAKAIGNKQILNLLSEYKKNGPNSAICTIL